MEAIRKVLSDPDGAPALRVLVVEDNDSDAMVAQAAVEKALRGPSEILRAATLANSLAIIKSSDVDLVLLDLNLPDSRGVETLKRMRVVTACPIIVVTVEDRPGLDEEALGNGAFEILHKGRLGPDAIVRLLRLAEDRRRAQGLIEDAEHRFRSLTELSSDWYWEQDKELRFTYYSPGFARLSGSTPEKNLGTKRWDEPSRVPLEGTWEEHRALLEARKPFRNLEFMRVDKDGERRFQSVNGEPFYDRDGNFAGYRGTSRDITERKLAEEMLERTRLRLELALAASRVCTWDYDLPSGEVVLSESWAEIIGAPPGETRTTFKTLIELVHPDDIESLRRTLTDVIKGQRTEYPVEHRVRHRSGEWRWIISRGNVVERDARGRAVRMAGTNLDITGRKLAEDGLRESEDRFRSLTELSSDWYWEQDENLRFVSFSGGFDKLGSSPESHYGKTRWELASVGVSEEQWAEHRALLEAHQPFQNFEFQRITGRGDTLWVSISGIPIFNAQGRFTGYRGIGTDITERKRAEARLAHLAQFDSVTGLPNRNLLGERLEQAITQARRHGRGAGVLFIDLDHFKLINDTLGHPAGDELLAQVGKRLRECVRPDDTVGRLSGDEFAVVVADLSRADDAALVAQKIIDWLAAPFDLFGQEAYVTASIGVAAFPNDGDGAGALLKCADTAMYRVKESSRNAFCFFAADMNARAASKLHLHTDLRHAVERREFQLHYQPKVALASGAMIGMEALIRWQHPVRGMISPMEFIPALEDTGLIVPVGDWVIEEARTQLHQWALAGLVPVPIAVNLSAKQFRRRDLDQVIRRLLAEHGISPQLLELEITESCLMDDPKDAVRQLHALRDSGLTISVDDFGTGYSSLSYLTRLPLSTLKIDRSFVNAAISDPSSAAIVKMVIDMAQSLRFNVVAEGIETNKHVDFLRLQGCEQGQGYHFGKPMTAEAIAPRLARQKTTRMQRENVVGRANVEDRPELLEYYRALEGEALGALWTVANEIEPWSPQPKSVPTLWAWKTIQPYVRKAAELVSAEKAARRVVMLVNPGRKEWSAAAGLLYTGVQVMNPGEFTSAHRHQASALRFVMEGRGAYTVVDGERLALGARDFVLTPNGTWHDHGVEAGGTQCVWQDGLDIPLMNALDANFYEVHPRVVQKPAPLSRKNWNKPYSPVFLYKWDDSYKALRKNNIFEYLNPLTGGPVMPTMGARLELIKKGTKPVRHTGSVIYQVATGRGWSEIGEMSGGKRFEWQEKDIFCVPSWMPYRHGAYGEAVLFSFNDIPAMQALSLYREQ